MNPTLRLRAFAKVNAGLKILGKRPDGYHEIRTVYQTIGLYDRIKISFAPRGGVTLKCSDPALPCDRGNLVYHACEAWKEKTKFKSGIQIELTKRIPYGAGLGGGSSDAAATLLGLERLTGDRLERAERLHLASALGSDVPLFLLGGRVLGCGRGEEVYPLEEFPARLCLVAHPGFSISTAEAYSQAGGHAARLTSPQETRKVNGFGVWSQFPLEGWGPAENDFETVVFAKWPELARVKRQLIRAGAETASLTGSGSAIYALFVSARQLNQAAKSMPRGWSVYITHTLNRAVYNRRLFAV